MNFYNIPDCAWRIRKLRHDYHYTQEAAAAQMKIDRRTLSNAENAVKGCSVDLLIRLAEFYNVSLDYLVLGADPGTVRLKGDLIDVIEQLTRLADRL